MRITKSSTHVVGTPWRNLTYVRAHTDAGLTGSTGVPAARLNAGVPEAGGMFEPEATAAEFIGGLVLPAPVGFGIRNERRAGWRPATCTTRSRTFADEELSP